MAQATNWPPTTPKPTPDIISRPFSNDRVTFEGRLDSCPDDFAVFLERFWSEGRSDIIPDPSPPPLPVLEISDDNVNDFSGYPSEPDKPDYPLTDPISAADEFLSPGPAKMKQQLHPIPLIPLSRTLTHYDSLLVEYYFSSVASLYSCFDGILNPFRTTISQLWTYSLVTKLTLQGMAAACLAREFPQLAAQGIHLSRRAVWHIDAEMRSGSLSNSSLLCLIMLGQSAGWHNEADLGLSHFVHANKLLRNLRADRKTSLLPNTNSSFFCQAMDYWRMILSFVSPLDEPEDGEDGSSKDTGLIPQIVPHPWALVVPDMMSSISEVGRLVYRHRRAFRNKKFWKQSDIDEMKSMISRCRELEHTLLKHRAPTEAEIVDTGDSCTPTSHLVKVAEAYRLISLIQLYRVFPDVLMERLQSSDHIELFNNVPRARIVTMDHISDDDTQQWLKGLALHTVDTLASLPHESHTRSIQAFLYVAISSELRKEGTTNVNSESLRVLQARNLVQSRLEAYRFIFAPKPAQRKLQLVLKIWELMDTSGKPVFWLDVMLDNNLEVVFC